MADRDVRFQIRLGPDLDKKVEDWRRAQPVIPTRNAAIRELLEQVLCRSEGKREDSS